MAAAILSFISITKPQMQILTCFSALLPNNNNNKLPKQNYRKLKQQQPSVMEIERAIGAGFFRDRDDIGSSEEKGRSLFEKLVGEKEGSVEKKLRETGEWLLHHSENTSPSAGKHILTTMFVWVIPLWIFGFLIAAGVLQLPFNNTPFMQDLLS